jgi:hypothetical protein
VSERLRLRKRLGPLRAKGLLAAALLVVGAADAAVIALTTGFFGGGYNSPILRGAGRIGAFVVGGAVLDAFLVVGVFSVALLIGRALRFPSTARVTFAAFLSVFVPIASDVVTHRLHRVFGQILGLDALIHLAGGRFGNAALEALSEAPWLAAMLSVGLVGAGAAIRLSRRIEGAAWGTPPSRAVLSTLLITSCLAGVAILAFTARRDPVLTYGFRHKPSAQVLGYLARLATDVDRDGFGLVSGPRDAAPFDARRHPFAIELPGNGIDENGIGGDMPADFRAALPFATQDLPGPRRPSFLLVYLESFRGDLVGLRFRDQEVTPVLNSLARRGASSMRAYAHTPLTWPSRAQMFQGSVVPRGGARTLIDDFRDLGYRVAYFSGQNDQHGGSDSLVGFERADAFYDARADIDQRTSRTALPVSLQVSADTVLARVKDYLDETSDDPRPLFLYVNLVDNHYPYHHDGLQRLLGVEPVTRPEIRPENARRVFETYLQASANVDRAIGELVSLWNDRLGDQPILVTGDHGQAFYEHDMLGHGQALDELQSRVPLIAVGIGGVWPEPIGMADLRGLLLTHLFAAPGRARFVEDANRSLFQYAGSLARPYAIALRGVRGANAWDFTRGAAIDPDKPGATTIAPPPLFWTWEHWQAEAVR